MVEISSSFHPLVWLFLFIAVDNWHVDVRDAHLPKYLKFFILLCDYVFYFSNKNPTLSVTHQNTFFSFFFFFKGCTFAKATLLFFFLNL